jgi:NAD(P)-dependent dehydrogenase (short-subunit alcohol dehydrogenase family)
MADKESNVVIITGGGRGIGAASARRLARDGWDVIIADTDVTAANSLAKSIGGPAIACDVGIEADIEALIKTVIDTYGRIDAIVSNAAINPRGPLSKLTLETWNRALAVNLTAAMLLARAAEAPLRAANGAMVLIASIRARMSEPNTLPYSASKGGLVTLTHALAMTLAPDVRVNCISPGWIDTSGGAPLSAADHAQHPVGRVGRPEDIAGAVAYLLSEDAAFMTGAELIIDGGMTRKMIYV